MIGDLPLGQLSDYLTWGAVTAYTIAMVCFATDLARVSEAIGARRRVKESVAVGGQLATPGIVGHLEPQEPISYVGRSTRALNIAMATTVVGAIIHLGAIVTRGIAAGHAPWANMYEFCLSGTFVAIAIFLGVQIFKEIRFLGVIVTLISVLFLVVGLRSFHIIADGVQPALQSYWLIVHVGIAVAATGVFTVAVATSVLQLLKDSRESGSTLLHGQGTVIRGKNRFALKALDWGWLEILPSATRLEALSFRINAIGFVMWTFTIIGGAIWADEAWGRAWGWDPKEVWSFVVWVIYAAYLHARTTRGWSGRRAAYFVLIGYATVLFNFTGVNILFSGKHSYGGL